MTHILTQLRVRLMNALKLRGPLMMRDNPRYADYAVGRYTYGRPRIYSWDQKTHLTIGSFCSIADEVAIILGGEHHTDWVTTYPFSTIFPEGKKFPGHPATKGDIHIGNDVWIGRGAVILSGVEIGDGAVIGAGCIVSKSILPYTVVGGNPQQTIRQRFSSKQIESLVSLAWWNWPIATILEALPLLLSGDVDTFISKYSNNSN